MNSNENNQMINIQDPLQNFLKLMHGQLFNRSGERTEEFDLKYIRKMIKGWKIKEFRFDENGEVQNPHVINELKKIMDRFCQSIHWNISNFIIKRSKNENDMVFQDALGGKIIIIQQVCDLIHDYIINSIDEKQSNKEVMVFAKLLSHMLDNYHGLVLAYISSDFLSVMQKSRMIYECHVIFLYIYKYRQIAEPFYDHAEIIDYNAYMLYEKMGDVPEEINKKKHDRIQLLKKALQEI